ncbi:MAG: alanine--tRNA ligase [Chloroflexota bacterium]
MTSNELRQAFLKFFDGKGHTVLPGSSLIPWGDPTLLLTTAGMVQIKPYFLGQAVPPNRRLASCQKCFRTTDIESVGDPTHLTFFEMLGNFSVGDYFKAEAISWAWEFVTRELKLPRERLWVSIFLDDEDASGYWRKLGVPEAKIVRLGEKDNFWGPAGNSGPCGPCSEIYYDFGIEAGCGRSSCVPGCNCGRFTEFWNLVFTQYNQDETGKRTLLPKPNIDTGMGLERAAALVQGKRSVYQNDLFSPLIKLVSGLAGKRYGAEEKTDNAIRVVAEHGRGIAFLIADGVLPANDGAGYVLRRLLRRSLLFSRNIGRDRPFLTEVAKMAVKLLGDVYPELKQRQEFIIKVIETEEARFKDTLETGLELIENVSVAGETSGTKVISGEDAFRLHDTFGFPIELTSEISGSRGLTVDMAGFEKEMAKQREKARAARRVAMNHQGTAAAGVKLNIEETPFVGYHTHRLETTIAGLLVGGKLTERVSAGQTTDLVLETTPFYAEKGGQVGDTGVIKSDSGEFTVRDTVRLTPGIIVHRGEVKSGSFTSGGAVVAEVDQARRWDIARNHTATHLVQNALRQVLGTHVEQRGSLVAGDRLRFDFSHLSALTRQEIQSVETFVNENIRRNLLVTDEELPYKAAIGAGAIALFDEKYGDEVRVIRIGSPAISTELCGGTHVGTTGEIGFFHILSESSIGAGLRRIEAATGRGAETFTREHFSSLDKIARLLKISPEEALDRVVSLTGELDEERRKVQALEKQLSHKVADSLLGEVSEVNGVKRLVASVPSSRLEALREINDRLIEQLKSAVVVLGSVYEGKPVFLAAVTPDLVSRGYDAVKIIRQVAGVAGGGGGGQARLAQAGGKYPDKLAEALALARKII